MIILLFIIFYGSAIYLLIRRYKNSEKKAEKASLEGEKEILSKLAKKHKNQAVFTIIYMLVVIVAIVALFEYMN